MIPRLPRQLKRLKFLCLCSCLMLVFQVGQAQTSTIKGVVTAGDDGSGLPRVSIREKGTTNGVVSELDGSYQITVAQGATLVFTFVGYISAEEVVGNRSTINVTLQPDLTELGEVVVVGYGTARKSDLTGSVASVSSEELTQIATPDVVQALQGRAAGVDVTVNSGEPGSGTRIRIRGVGTINNSDPLYVVDGFQTNDLSFLNPNDVESMEILKDASATAIYGSRGANGVVLITTKKAEQGKAKFVFDAYAGVQEVANTLDLTTAAEYAELRLEAFANDGITLPSDGDVFTRLDFVRQGNYRGTDWQDEIMQTAAMQNYSLSVSGGNDVQNYILTATYFSQEGVIKNTGMDKFFLRLKNRFSMTDWLNTGINIAYVNTDKSNYNGDQFSGVLPSVLRIDPVTPAFDVPTNNWGRADLAFINNPARIVDESQYDNTVENKIVANVDLEATIMDGLTFKTQFGIDLKNIHRKQFLPEFFIATDEARDQSSLFEQRAEQLSWVWSNYFTYTKEMGDHFINATLGVENQLSRWRSMNATGFDVPQETNLQFLSAANNPDFTVNSAQSQETLQSFFARANYSFKDKYVLTGTVRYDGSSRFLSDQRWGTFPSFSAGWIASDEDFFPAIKGLDFFKVRAGWGQVGNQNSVGNYSYVTRVSNNQLYTFNGQIVQGAASLELSNPEIQWETTETLNFGVDLGFMDNRVNVTADYFIRDTDDMILEVPIPVYAGTGRPFANAGSMRNQGVELSLGYKNYDNPFKYDFSFNIAKITNEVTSLGGGEPIASGDFSQVGNTTLTEEGSELAYFYGLRTDGIFNDQAELDAHVNGEGDPIQPAAQPGDVKFVDVNGDGVIDDNDRVNLGSAIPDFTFGFSSNFSYGNWDLRLFIHGSQGNELVNILSRYNLSSDGMENSRTRRLARWTPENPNTDEPRMTNADANGNILRFSDRYVEDGSFIRIKNIQIGYTFPTEKLSQWGVSSMRVYFSGDNLFTITDYTGFDPEVAGAFGNPLFSGVDLATYPPARVLRFGLNVTF